MRSDSQPDNIGLIVDTDIGTDVDDVMALVVLGRLAGSRLRAVTTVYGDSVLRARMAAHVCGALGLDEVAIFPGALGAVDGSAPWTSGSEGEGWPLAEQSDNVHGTSNPEALIEALKRETDVVDVIAIGPLTNLAHALAADPSLAERVRHLYLMGGLFGGRAIEHNFRCDPLAAHRVFASSLDITVVGLESTWLAWFDEVDAQQIEAEGDEVTALVLDQARRWWGSREGDALYGEPLHPVRTGDSPHDVVCVLSALRPDLFTTSRCTVSVQGEGPRAGACTAELSSSGRHNLVTRYDVDATHDLMLHAFAGTSAEAVASGRDGR